MFIGKPICMIAAAVMAVTCGAAATDKKVSIKSKLSLAALSITLVGIVSSL